MAFITSKSIEENYIKSGPLAIIGERQVCAAVVQLKRLNLTQTSAVTNATYLCVHMAYCCNEFQTESDSNSRRSEQQHIGLVCYNPRCRSVAVADDNKLVVVLVMQSMEPKMVCFHPNEKSVHNSQLLGCYARREIRMLFVQSEIPEPQALM